MILRTNSFSAVACWRAPDAKAWCWGFSSLHSRCWLSSDLLGLNSVWSVDWDYRSFNAYRSANWSQKI